MKPNQFHKKNLGKLDLINPEVIVSLKDGDFQSRITLFVVNLTSATKLSSESYKFPLQ